MCRDTKDARVESSRCTRKNFERLFFISRRRVIWKSTWWRLMKDECLRWKKISGKLFYYTLSLTLFDTAILFIRNKLLIKISMNSAPFSSNKIPVPRYSAYLTRSQLSPPKGLRPFLIHSITRKCLAGYQGYVRLYPSTADVQTGIWLSRKEIQPGRPWRRD